MFFLSPLLFSGALAAAQDIDEAASTSSSTHDIRTASTAPAGSMTTVFVTVTRTLYPVKTYPIPSYPPPTAKSSHFDSPASYTHDGQQGEPLSLALETTNFLAGPIYQYTSLMPAKIHTASFAPYYPGASLTGQREFTFNDPSTTTIPFEGHHTPVTSKTTKSMCGHQSTETALSTSSAVSTPYHPSPTRSNSGYHPSPSSALYTASSQPYATPTRSNTGYAPSPGHPTVSGETVDIMPIPTPTDNDYDILPLPDEEETVGILPLPDAEETVGILPLPTEELVRAFPTASAISTSFSAPSRFSARPTSSSVPHRAPLNSTIQKFTWPTTSPNADIDNSDNSADILSDSIDDATAWSGTDNAIPAQLRDPPQARTLPWLSPPPLHSTSAAVRRVRRFWHDVFERRNVVGAVNNTNETAAKSGIDGGEKERDCIPCKGDGEIICKKDVAIGYCWRGCAALQTLGRGHECSLYWDLFSSATCVQDYIA